MEQIITNLFNESIIKKAAFLFELDLHSIHIISESESYVYRAKRKNQDVILRITHNFHREEDTILGELEWISYLSDHHVLTSRPIESIHSNVMEVVSVGDSYFIISLFSKAPGSIPSKKDWNSTFFKEWGKTLGRMHFLSKNFQLSKKAKRPIWNKEYNIAAIHNVLLSEPTIIEQQKKVLDEIVLLPKDSNSFGLIHSDFETENFHWYNGQVYPFDFDESQFHWFVYDLANIVRQASWVLPTITTKYSLEEFLNYVIEGYLTENPIDEICLSKLDLFLKLRDLCIYVYIHGKRDINNFSKEEFKFVEYMKQCILAEVPTVKLDIQRFI